MPSSRNHGGLHVLVNNAGITRDMLAMRLKDDGLGRRARHQSQGGVPREPCRDPPDDEAALWRIISITSVVGAAGNPGQANYAALRPVWRA